MSQVVPNAPQEFWRPPAIQSQEAEPPRAAACPRCDSEFMVGASFCYVCGAARPQKSQVSAEPDWTAYLNVLRVLEFHNVKAWLGLSTASLVAFLIGLGCLLSAVSVGIIYSVQTMADFQAIQLWRIQWLLAALAAFVAGILLKRPHSEK